ncbi:hypothetical protein AB9H28_23995, partial [Salmonella enterica subsp. enterica serovar Kentucky]|uniref:hypothetical protein n=1 Tax=Salmonella enterica TaxID=28901 RepID=UPI003F4B3DE0
VPRARADNPRAHRSALLIAACSPRQRVLTDAFPPPVVNLHVFPAPAGINRGLSDAHREPQRVPRASGDKPT